jgi:hypothetical protein
MDGADGEAEGRGQCGAQSLKADFLCFDACRDVLPIAHRRAVLSRERLHHTFSECPQMAMAWRVHRSAGRNVEAGGEVEC